LNSKITDLQYEYDELSRKFTTNKTNHETKEQAYRSAIEKLEYQLAKENRLRQALEQSAGSERQHTTAKDNVIESLTHSLQKSKDDNLYLHEKITLLETEKEKLADRINFFNKRNQNSDSLVVKDLREKLAVADDKARALAIQVSEKDILEERLARLTNQFERKARELGDLQRKYNTLLQNSDFDDSSRIRQLEHEISRLQVEIDGKDELIKDLKKPMTTRNTTPKRASFHARRSDQSSEPSPIVKKENELLKVQLRRSRDMIKKMKLNCQELIDFVQMILNVRLNERDDIFAEEQWERRLRDLKDVINQKTPMQSPSRHEMSFLGSRDGLNMSGAKRQLFGSNSSLDRLDQQAEIDRLRHSNQLLQQRLAINHAGYLTPPEGEYQLPVNNIEHFTVSKQNYMSLRETIKHTLLTLGLSKKSVDETSLDPVFKSIKHLERLLGDYVIPTKKSYTSSSGVGTINDQSPQKPERQRTISKSSKNEDSRSTISITSQENLLLKGQLENAKEKLMEREEKLTKAMLKLAQSEKIKNAFESKVKQQLQLTHQVLQKANTNLKE